MNVILFDRLDSPYSGTDFKGNLVVFMKDGNPLGEVHFPDKGWFPRVAIDIGIVTALELKHSDDRCAFWFFDHNKVYIGNYAKSLSNNQMAALKSVLMSEADEMWESFMSISRGVDRDINKFSGLYSLSMHARLDLFNQFCLDGFCNNEVIEVIAREDCAVHYPVVRFCSQELSVEACRNILVRNRDVQNEIVDRSSFSTKSPLTGNSITSSAMVMISEWHVAFLFIDGDQCYFVIF